MTSLFCNYYHHHHQSRLTSWGGSALQLQRSMAMSHATSAEVPVSISTCRIQPGVPRSSCKIIITRCQIVSNLASSTNNMTLTFQFLIVLFQIQLTSVYYNIKARVCPDCCLVVCYKFQCQPISCRISETVKDKAEVATDHATDH